MTHFCQRILWDYDGIVFTELEDEGKDRCNKIARFYISSSALPGSGWFCAECYDYVIAVNRKQHNKYGVPLIETQKL